MLFSALFETVCCHNMILHFMLVLCICPFAHYMRIDYILRMVQRDKNCMCCSSWLQYRICHSLSTIQYVLVPQVQRQLQAALLHAAGSRSGSGSRPRLQLGRGGRHRQAEGSPQDQLRNSQCQDSRKTHTCQGETGLTWGLTQTVVVLGSFQVWMCITMWMFLKKRGDLSATHPWINKGQINSHKHAKQWVRQYGWACFRWKPTCACINIFGSFMLSMYLL